MKYIDIKNGYTKEVIRETADIVKSGGILILPTDTVYGIVSSALEENAVSKIYEIKNREKDKPLNILVSNIDMIKKSVKSLNETEEKIINKFFPGALTMVFNKNTYIPEIVTGGLDTIGIRMPKNKFLLELIEELRISNSCNKL